MRGLTISSTGFRNSVLRSPDPAAIQRLHVQLVQPEKARRALTTTDRRPEHVFFLEADYVSILVPLQEVTLSAGTLGSKSVIGAHNLCGETPSRHYYELPPVCRGDVYASPIEDAQLEFNQSEKFRRAVLSSLFDETTQAIQLCACNATHDVERRLSRWLLLCHAELEGDDISATHEMVASALGICRSTATTAIDLLQRSGILKTSRGMLRILDRDALEARACECYSIIRNSHAAFEKKSNGFRGIQLAAPAALKNYSSIADLNESRMQAAR